MRPDKIKNFKLNAEMLGKVSRFLSSAYIYRPATAIPYETSIRIEQFYPGGAKITVTDGCRVIIFIDPGSDYSGPALTLENQGYPLSKFTKECRKTKSSIEKLQGYALFKPDSGKVSLNGKTFKFSFNTDKWMDIGDVLENITMNKEKKRNLPLFNSRYINSIQHCILAEDSKFSTVAFSHCKMKNTDELGVIAFSRYAMLLIFPLKPGTHEQNLLSRINYFINQEINPFVVAVMQKEWGGIFTKFKLSKSK
jgi:hypothetical protein